MTLCNIFGCTCAKYQWQAFLYCFILFVGIYLVAFFIWSTILPINPCCFAYQMWHFNNTLLCWKVIFNTSSWKELSTRIIPKPQSFRNQFLHKYDNFLISIKCVGAVLGFPEETEGKDVIQKALLFVGENCIFKLFLRRILSKSILNLDIWYVPFEYKVPWIFVLLFVSPHF